MITQNTVEDTLRLKGFFRTGFDLHCSTDTELPVYRARHTDSLYTLTVVYVDEHSNPLDNVLQKIHNPAGALEYKLLRVAGDQHYQLEELHEATDNKGMDYMVMAVPLDALLVSSVQQRVLIRPDTELTFIIKGYALDAPTKEQETEADMIEGLVAFADDTVLKYSVNIHMFLHRMDPAYDQSQLSEVANSVYLQCRARRMLGYYNRKKKS